ncbi:MAG: TonB family protein, partial [Calditrichaeota bacterium]
AEEPKKRFNALFKAIEFDRRDIVSVLLQRGAQVNYHNTFGVTPLMLAAQLGRKEIVDLLLQKKADVNAASIIGYTPLFFALEFGRPEIAQVLIEAGAHADQADKYNRSVLAAAAAKGYSQIVEQLVQKGADVNVKSEKGETAISLANKNAFTDVVVFLLKHGADSTGVKIAADSTAQDSTLTQKEKDAVVEETVAVVPPEPIGGLEAIQKRLRYPKKAKEAGLQGTIKLEVTVTRVAQIKSIKIIETFGDRECEKAAETACRNTRWKPAKKGKKSVEGTAVVTLEFKLEP